ncbi:hypothetical protein [Actinokineospora inagensis]|nr:hypothetical protein [Actinokineospora inagensis]
MNGRRDILATIVAQDSPHIEATGVHVDDLVPADLHPLLQSRSMHQHL